MNAPIRRVAVALLAMLGLLFVNTNYIQVVRAERYRDDPRNSRVLVDEYSRARGQIVAGDVAIATSVETDGRYKYRRSYPGGALYAPFTGYFSLVFGSAGVERGYDDVLSGDDSRLFVRRLSDIVTGREPEGGVVELTVNRELQRTAADALGNRRGAVIALDPKTGAVLAMVTSPSYNPNLLSAHNTAAITKSFKQLSEDPRKPLTNRATQFTYPPGSVFKVITAAAAIESGRYQPDTLIDSPREFPLPNSSSTLKNFGGSTCGANRIPLAEAFQRSCNADFGGLGVALGGDALRAQAERFGLNSVPAFDLPVSRSRYPDEVDRAQAALTAIGQYDVRVTPLQMALVAATVANRGVPMRPHVVRRTLTSDLRELEAFTPVPLGERAVSPETAAALATMMESVVSGPFGTGKRAAIPGVRVAGKTGTAQHAEGRPPHAWFIGFAPVEAPRIAIAVVVEDGGDLGSEATGGRIAAPIAQAVIQALLAEKR